MCLFKRDAQENTCAHEECKNYYLLNKQICMYSKPGQSEAKSTITNFPADSRDELLDSLQKRIKKENDLKVMFQDRESNPISLSMVQNVLNPMALTQMIQTPLKAEALMLNSSGLIFPVPSQQQNMLQDFQSSLHQQANPSMNLSNMNLAQLIRLKNQNNSLNLLSNVQSPQDTTLSSDSSNDNSMKDFQTKLFSVVFSQNKILTELKERSDLLQNTLTGLVTEVVALKSNMMNPVSGILPISSNNTIVGSKMFGKSTDSISTSDLLTCLYGPNANFPYQLVLQQDLSLPLYRERNFRLTVLLTDLNGNLVQNTNRIPVSLAMYTSENPPKFIEANTSGNKILKGQTEKDLINGTATFEKIQIKEVTSHFRNGWVFFVVLPKTTNNGNLVTLNGNQNFVRSQGVKPLILERVIVKAKKTKEKENSGDVDGNQVDETEQEKEDA